jgi:hypothetical protein
MPFVLLVGLTVNVTPLQLTVVIAVISAVGVIVTVKVNGAPNPQFTILGVTIYVAVLAILVVLFKVPLITLTGTLCDTPPVKPTPVGADHIYVVPAGIIPFNPSIGVIAKLTPLHVVVVIAFITDPGLIVTVKLNDAPAHTPDTGLTIYVAVTAELVILVKVPVITLTPLTCVTPPVKPVPVGADQVYKVPSGITPLVTSVGVTLKVPPLHIVAVIGVILANGLIVTVTVNVAPVQFPDNGVTT